jgi:2-oxoglutarate ferredoxin oxidoreductase subunit gamma
MIVKILFAGSGGQGVISMGNVFAKAAMLDDYYVTHISSYGAAVRGGTANCTVCISDEEIASPVASSPDFIVALNKPSAQSFINKLDPGGQLIYNQDLIDSVPYRGDIDLFPVPANTVAKTLKNEKAANMILLGSLAKLTNILKTASVHESINSLFEGKKKAAASSIQAFDYGYSEFPFKDGKK